MSKGNQFENDWLKLVFNGVPIPGLADNAAVSPISVLWVAAHTADPGEAGDQTTNEVSYSGYSRVGTPRTTAGWTVVNNTVSPAAPVFFPTVSSGTGTITHISVGVGSSGASKILYKGPLSPNIVLGANVTPQLKTTSTISED